MISDYEIVGEWNGIKLVAIVAHIRKNETGEIRRHKDSLMFENDEESPHYYIWEDGNYSCDCNRHLFFQRAGNEDEIDEDTVCGDMARFCVNLYNPKTGECLYREFDEADPYVQVWHPAALAPDGSGRVFNSEWRHTPMPADYTCRCGIYVHPSQRNPEDVHVEDCPYHAASNVAVIRSMNTES